jgi:hypothetical protein
MLVRPVSSKIYEEQYNRVFGNLDDHRDAPMPFEMIRHITVIHHSSSATAAGRSETNIGVLTKSFRLDPRRDVEHHKVLLHHVGRRHSCVD